MLRAASSKRRWDMIIAMTTVRPKVLIAYPFFEPAHLAGGPIQSIRNIIANLGDRFDFHVACSDRDIDGPLGPSVVRDRWIDKGTHKQIYLTGGLRKLLPLLRSGHDWDTVYLASLMSPRFNLPLAIASLTLRRKTRTVVAPRGGLYDGAMAIRPKAKSVLVKTLAGLGAGRPFDWHVTSEEEAAIVSRLFGAPADAVHFAENMTESPGAIRALQGAFEPRGEGEALRLVYFSRVSPKKNVLGAIRALSACRQPVSYDIYGVVDDGAYWARCQEAIADLPDHVTIRHLGPYRREELFAQLHRYDGFFFPTFGENFGHAIFEALAAGLPPVIGSDTPWHGAVSAAFGSSIDPGDTVDLTAAIESLAGRGAGALAQDRDTAHRIAQDWFASSEAVAAHRRMFLGTPPGESS